MKSQGFEKNFTGTQIDLEQTEVADIQMISEVNSTWTLITDRLPKVPGYYQVTYQLKEDLQTGHRRCHELWFSDQWYFEEEMRNSVEENGGIVIAWKPMSDPYVDLLV